MVTKSFKPLYGMSCWGIRWDPQLNLSLNFGKPFLKIREPYNTKSTSKAIKRLAARRQITIRGEWYLWVYGSYWKIFQKNEQVASSSSSARRKDAAIAGLEGQKLIHVTINPKNGKTRFDFDLGGILEVRRFDAISDLELWMLYEPNGYVLSCKGDGKLIRKRRCRSRSRRPTMRRTSRFSSTTRHRTSAMMPTGI
jgi:hypothetical protein